jgi:predicted Zn-dependent protease
VKFFAQILWIPLLVLMASSCATNPVSGQQDFVTLSEAEEIEQGKAYHQTILAQYGVYDDPDLQKYVTRIGQELAANSHRSQLKFTFTLLDSPEINAFALPGGYVYITRGIMAYLGSEAELAGVLGHEIGHVTARHSVRQQSGQLASTLLNVLITAATGSDSLGSLSQQLGTGLIRGYGREHELEADRLGAEYLHKTGYDPESMIEVIGVLKDQEVYERALAKKQNRSPNIYHGVFSTHPENDQRLQTVVRAASSLSDKDYRDSNQADYYHNIDGMTWGQNIKQGVVVDNRFSHPDLAFALQLPVAWRVRNNPDYLEAKNSDTGAFIRVSLITRNKNESAAAILKRLRKDSKLKVSKESYGATAKIRIRLSNSNYQPARISAIEFDDAQAMLLFGTAGEAHFDASDTQFRMVNQSFVRLTPQQVSEIRAARLHIIDRSDGDSFNSLALKSAIEYDAASILRLLNRAFPDGKIDDLEKIKIVNFDD